MQPGCLREAWQGDNGLGYTAGSITMLRVRAHVQHGRFWVLFVVDECGAMSQSGAKNQQTAQGCQMPGWPSGGPRRCSWGPRVWCGLFWRGEGQSSVGEQPAPPLTSPTLCPPHGTAGSDVRKGRLWLPQKAGTEPKRGGWFKKTGHWGPRLTLGARHTQAQLGVLAPMTS